MKFTRYFYLVALFLALLIAPALQTGCSTPPSARVKTVQTLLAVGHSAEATVALSAQLYRDHRITAVQAQAIIDFYNLKFQPAYRVAVLAAQSNYDSLASPDLLALAAALAALIPPQS